jgi:uncharacterized protein (TIGR02466 family)
MERFFSTLIYKKKLLSNSARLNRLIRELAKESYKIRDYDHAGKVWCKKNYPLGYTSYGSLSQMYEMSTTFDQLRKFIDPHVNKVAKDLDWDLGKGQLEMNSLWININSTNSYHGLHLHPLAVLSGTFYVEVPKDSGAIKFEDPRMNSFMATPPPKPKARSQNQRTMEIKSKAGELVLFESWLRHEVTQNLSSEDRVSISFNYEWR